MEKLKKYFEDLRNNPNHHLGLGDIRLTIGQQEEILQIVEEYGNEMLHEYPPVYGNPDKKGITSKELAMLDGIDDLMKESLDRPLKAEWSEKHEIVLERAILFKFPSIRGLTVSEGKVSFDEGSAPETEVKQFLDDLKNFKT